MARCLSDSSLVAFAFKIHLVGDKVTVIEQPDSGHFDFSLPGCKEEVTLKAVHAVAGLKYNGGFRGK